MSLAIGFGILVLRAVKRLGEQFWRVWCTVFQWGFTWSRIRSMRKRSKVGPEQLSIHWFRCI